MRTPRRLSAPRMLSLSILIISLAINTSAQDPSPSRNVAVSPLAPEPVSLSSTGAGIRGSSFHATDGQQVLIETPDFICLLELRGTSGSCRERYVFRTFNLKSGQEIRGDGEVFEQFYRISTPKDPAKSTTVVDRGSVLYVDAGFIKVRWSCGRWLYVDSTRATISASSEAEYERKIGLKVSAKSGKQNQIERIDGRRDRVRIEF